MEDTHDMDNVSDHSDAYAPTALDHTSDHSDVPDTHPGLRYMILSELESSDAHRDGVQTMAMP